MEELSLNDWPGQTIDLSGSNSWLPAYGFQPPMALLEKEDFLGNPDADLFLNGSIGQHFVYLETIQEETLDDLKSDSDKSESRASPVGWLATDSETGSVIRIDLLGDIKEIYVTDPVDSESDREISCAAKRRRLDNNYLGISDEESSYSLSRSSSLLQFENLEKQCQDLSSSSPSIFSNYSFDSLEHQRKNTVSPDSLERDNENESDYSEPFKIGLSENHVQNKNVFNNFSLSYIEKDHWTNSDDTLYTSTCQNTKSFNVLKTWRSFDNIASGSKNKQLSDKASIENLSEDSGYSEHLHNSIKYKSKSNSNIKMQITKNRSLTHVNKTDTFDCNKGDIGFDAYDGDVSQNFTSSFGVSCQDLSICDKYSGFVARTPLIDRFIRNDVVKQLQNGKHFLPLNRADALKIEDPSQCGLPSKYNATSSSEPNLLQSSSNIPIDELISVSIEQFNNQSQNNYKQNYFENVCVSSVPIDLNYIVEYKCSSNACPWIVNLPSETSIAAKNCDIGDIQVESLDCDVTAEMIMSQKVRKARNEPIDTKVIIKLKNDDSTSSSSDSAQNKTYFKREGSYLEAMANRVDDSDSESNHPLYNKTYSKSPFRDFDQQILKAISEGSMQNLEKTKEIVCVIPRIVPQNRNVNSTPNLTVSSKSNDICFNNNSTLYSNDNKRFSAIDMPRKSSLINRSTSTSRVSDSDDQILPHAKSLSSSSTSKGVHFCPIVAKVNWKDDSDSTEKESSYSLSSTPERDIKKEDVYRASPINDVHENTYQNRGICRNGIEYDEEYYGCETKHVSRPIIRPTPRKMSASQPALLETGNSDSVKLKNYTAGSLFIPLTENATFTALNQPEVAMQMCSKSTPTIYDENNKVLKADAYAMHDPANAKPSISVLQPVPSALVSHMTVNNKPQLNTTQKTVSSMEPNVVCRQSKSARSGKLGGFFSRLASFRFSSRKSSEEKSKQKKKHVQQDNLPSSQRVATQEDYIYIPLKVPVEDANQLCNSGSSQVLADSNCNKVIATGITCVNSKPPLPKLPPRVVGASVKKRLDVIAHSTTTEPRTIDPGDVLPRPMEPMGLIETDLDTEVTVITSGAHVKTRSLMNLGAEAPPRSLAAPTLTSRPHKSMEFLLDKDNLKVVEPPENELQKGERVMSEHQLRVQRSLQKLTVPDWYKQAQVPREGFLLKKNLNRESRWAGTNSKTTSLSSLGSSNHSPIVLSPVPHSQPFVRWSLSKLNSTASSPCASTRSSFNARQPNGSISPSSLRNSFSYRQPYLGWRSQERLSKPRTPAERLANSLLNQNNLTQQQESPEIQTSIKEVTSAIVHYVSGLKPDDSNAGDYKSYDSQETVSQRSRSVSPRGSQKLCWLESSFVGIRPLDTPPTPVTLTSQSTTPLPPTSLRLDLQPNNDVTLLSGESNSKRPSPGSTTLEDVLDSLLGLPSSTRAPSPSPQVTVSANTSPSRFIDGLQLTEQFRRRSEGSEPTIRSSSTSRRVSFHTSPVLRCRYSRCGKSAVGNSTYGLAFKSCHNCSYTYCSRACRRAHWEKHRKTCLFSRVGSLCRHVIAAVKEQPDTLLHLSIIARRGYLSQGHGAVKCFFPCAEDAEKFLSGQLDCLGEPTFVRWADLLPSEMGSQLYAELVKMCKNYNPDSKLVLYISVCVISEAPAAGAVKWERQLVSRCAKMRLSKNITVREKDTDNPETLVLTSNISKDSSVQRSREISFKNIQRHLCERGISLKQQYPDIYQQLCVYVEGNCDKFAPVTVYPRDMETGKTFMCIIMPDADPESLRQVKTAGVRVRTVDILQD